MKVYRQYDQQQLNEQYNTRLQVPDFASYLERWEGSSRAIDKKYNFAADIFYGEDPLECLDIFPAEKPAAKTMIFIHGGYWHLLDKSMFHFLAQPFLQQNVTTVVINYPLAPVVTIDHIVASCQKAVQWVHENISRYNGDPSEIYVMGHSAGGHLAAMLLTIENILPLKGVISLSGLFRLEPIMHSYVNDVLEMGIGMAERNSPVLLKPLHTCPLLLFTGCDESNEFQTQNHELYNRWKSQQVNTRYLSVETRNHYSILDTITEQESPVQAQIFELMKLVNKT